VSAPATTKQDALIAELRLAFGELLGAERRLRARDQQRRDGLLTIAQIRVLMALKDEDELPAGQLAKRAELNPASVTAMLDHLEAEGIIERRRSTEDRRMCFVSLTPQGSELVERKRAYWQQRWQERFGDTRASDLAAAAKAMHAIAEMLDEL
jgi:DNA-binding MarR family transcriptional regulator